MRDLRAGTILSLAARHLERGGDPMGITQRLGAGIVVIGGGRAASPRRRWRSRCRSSVAQVSGANVDCIFGTQAAASRRRRRHRHSAAGASPARRSCSRAPSRARPAAGGRPHRLSISRRPAAPRATRSTPAPNLSVDFGPVQALPYAPGPARRLRHHPGWARQQSGRIFEREQSRQRRSTFTFEQAAVRRRRGNPGATSFAFGLASADPPRSRPACGASARRPTSRSTRARRSIEAPIR